MTRSRWVVAVLVAVGLLAGGLGVAVGSGAGDAAGSWEWSADVPGTPLPVDSDVGLAEPHELAAADDFTLVVGERDGELMIGPLADGRVEAQSLAAAADGALLSYSAAEPEGEGQQLVGVARSDVDRVEAVLADGTVQELPLNQWRAFAYEADGGEAATTLVAYSSASAVAAITVPQTTAQGTARKTAAPVYGIFRSGGSDRRGLLARVDSKTLQPLSPPRLSLPPASGYALSPDGRGLAVASYDPEQLVIVDLPTMRIVSTAPLGDGERIHALSWSQPRRVIALVQRLKGPYGRNVGTRETRILDSSSGRWLSSRPVTTKLGVAGSAAVPQGLVVLLQPSGYRGPQLQLVLATPEGTVRTAEIPAPVADPDHPRFQALTVDSSTGRAYVVTGDGTFYDVDLAKMQVNKHDVAAPAGTVAPLTTAYAQPSIDLLGHDLVVSGVFPATATSFAAGIALVDTDTWQARLIDATASGFNVLGDRLLTYRVGELPADAHAFPPKRAVGQAINLYDESSSLIGHPYPGRGFQSVQVSPGYGHILYNGSSTPTWDELQKQLKGARSFYLGPNDQLAFGLDNASPVGGGTLSRRKPPSGPPLLIFRGSRAVSESGSRSAS